MNKPKILIVEDESIVSLEIQSRLEDLGYAVSDAVFSGEDAIQSVEKILPDLILMDINLRSDLDGIETSKQIREKYNVPIIYMTAYSDDETLQRAKVSSPYAFIIKPIEVRELHTSIEIALFKSSMEKKLIESEKRFRSLFENATLGLYRTSICGKLLMANNALKNMLGYDSDEEIEAKNSVGSGYVNPKRRDEFIELLNKNGNIVGFESEWKRKDGSIIYISESARKDIDENGNVIFEGTVEDITKRKIAENNLKESEEILSTVFNSGYNGIIIHDLDGKIIKVNERVLSFHNITIEQALKLNISDIVKSPSNLEKLRSEWKNVLNGENKVIEIKTNSLKDSQLYDIEIYLTKLSIKENNYILANLRNITEQKRSNNTLIRTKEILRKVFDNVYNAIFIHDVNGEIIDVNDKVLSMYNLSKNEALSMNISQISSDDSPMDKALEYWRSVVAGENQLFEWKAKRPKENFEFPVEVFLTKISIDNNDFILANVRDITYQKLAQKKLVTTQMAVEMGSSPIFFINKKAEITYVNNAAVKMLGYSFEELTKMKVPDLDPNWNQDFWDNVGYPRLVELGSDQFETSQISKSGETIPIEVSSTIIFSEGEEIVVAIITNLTERKRAADSLISAKESAEKSNRLKTEFLASMSHEIRTPVNTILSYSSLLKDELYDLNLFQFEDIFRSISIGGQRLIRTVDSILNMSQMQTGTYEVIVQRLNLNEEVLYPLFDEFKIDAVNKGLQLHLERNSNNSFINGDSYSVGQLFTNLIDNAIKYTNQGEIIIKSYNLDDNKLYVDVTDTGIGISDEFLTQIFNPFTQETQGYSRKFEGNGLGLALVKKYCSLNNAEIFIKSKKGKGSTFTVKFNCAD
ncbi:MAG: PAS domain S-box protein [Ignavibacteriae bacterium]|nr:PAS domain S-box protein [Ignavibacteriota bacterium]